MKRKHDNEELGGLENLIYTPLPLELDKRSFEWCGSKGTALIHSFTCLEYPLVALRARNISIELEGHKPNSKNLKCLR